MNLPNQSFSNPFRPGAGHQPPYLAGREQETQAFQKLLTQEIILENMVLTGLRGVGKTVLLDKLKPLAIREGWKWVGTDLSESASISENSISIRLLTDLSLVTSNVTAATSFSRDIGFTSEPSGMEVKLTYGRLEQIFNGTPGLILDKLKTVLEMVWECVKDQNIKGFIFSYDEAQNLSDHTSKEQFPLSLLLDLFQSIQKKGIPFMLLLTGLPTLFSKLVDARTYSERMFHILFLDRLTHEDSKDAILKPIENINCPLKLNDESVTEIVELSGGYPYFIQFICREVFDIFIQKNNKGQELKVPVDAIIRKLDTNFFAGRWGRTTDRQRDLLSVIARSANSDSEFTVQEIVDLSNQILVKPFGGSSQVNQMLSSLANAGLIYKNRHGRYSFAVPLMGQFIIRETKDLDQNLQ